jgi:hypothetical protein
MSGYAAIDAQIQRWAERHALGLYTSSPSGEIRAAHVSSVAGECFQIWIEPAAEDHLSVYAAGIEGRKEDAPPVHWRVPISGLEAALETAFETVIGWMAPSERYYPPANS